MVVRWNRTVTEQWQEAGTFPTFKEFVAFAMREARIANNPISSLKALKEWQVHSLDTKVANKGHSLTLNKQLFNFGTSFVLGIF